MILSFSQISFVDLQCITFTNIEFSNPPRIALTTLELSLRILFVALSDSAVVGAV